MKIKITGKNVEVTPALAEKIENKLGFLDKYFIIDDTVTANVLLKVYRKSQKIEITIPTKFAVLRAEVAQEDLYAAIDLAIDKLEDQIRKQKTRLQRKNKEKLAMSFIEEGIEDDNDVFVKTKSIIAESMDLDEAIMRMEMLGHAFFIYRDEEDNSVSVVYRRNDGGYGLIETE